MKLMQLLKSIHGWLGVLLLPWVVVIGLTGFYLNHGRLVDAYLPSQEIDENSFAQLATPLDEPGAITVAQKYITDGSLNEYDVTDYHDRPAIIFKLSRRDEFIVDVNSGYSFHKTGYRRVTRDQSGAVIDTKIYWGGLFKQLHTDGWFSSALGTWLADIVSICMAVFGLSGLYLFLWPRLRRRSLRRAA